MKTPFLTGTLALLLTPALHAELKLPAIIGDSMVLQQKQADPVWGWDTPGTKITVTFGGQTKTAEAGAEEGRWTVKLDPMPANAQGQTLTVEGTSKREVKDVLVGEVWMCSGQSNMGFTLKGERAGDVEMAASRRPGLRLVRVPDVGTQEPQKDFKGEWKVSGPESSANFSAVGFLFGRYLYDTLQVPVGLIDNSWGGSAAEAWVRRELLEKNEEFKPLMESTVKHEATANDPKMAAAHEAALEKWKAEVEKAKAEGRAQPRPPSSPSSWLSGNARPGNIYNGKLVPTMSYGMKGVIWYQGESNASHAYEYRRLFPFMIEQWRKDWGQGDFPFYWVQLANYMARKDEPGESAWAELREAQTKTQSLPQTGQAVIIDIGEGKDIHPRDKHDVATRLVRWALAKDYGQALPFRSPEYKSLEVKEDGSAVVTLDCFGGSLRPFGVVDVKGLAVCGEDHVWHWATGTVKGKEQVVVKCAEVPKPVAVRYAWADNPDCNLYTETNLPVTPFRTDDFEMTTKPKP